MSETTTAVEPPDDIRSAVAAAMAAHEAPAVETRETPPDAPEAAQPAPERPRAPDGKFAKADQPADAPVPTETEAAEPTTEAPKPAEDDTLTKATANWSEADRSMLKGLPTEAQQFVLRRHQEMVADHTRKTQAIAAFRRDYEPVAQLFEPHLDTLRRAGMTPASTISAWVDAEKALADKSRSAAFVADVVNRYGIDKAAVARSLGLSATTSGAPAEAPAPQPEAPQQGTVPPEVLQKLQAFENYVTQQQQRENAMTAHQVMSTIGQFRDAADQAGRPLHPHFAEVEDDMAALAHAARTRGGDVPSLDQLYDQAVWANPSTRQKLQAEMSAAAEAQRSQAEARRRDEARAKAESARRASAPVTGAPGNTGQAGSRRMAASSVREALEAAMEEHEAA